MTGTLKLNRAEWTEQFTALYDLALGNLPNGEEGELSVCVYDYNRKRDTATWKPLGAVPFQTNSDRLAWDLIEPYAAYGSSVYFGVGIRRTGTGGQGKETDVLAHSALGVDLDAATGDHAASDDDTERESFADVTEDQIASWIASGEDGKRRELPRATREEADGWTQEQYDLWLSFKGKLPLPTVDEIDGWIENMPLEPTMVTETGGGFHVYLALDNPVEVQYDSVGKRLRAGWIAHWLGTGYESRRHVDPGPLKNAAGVLRMAGTPNHKHKDFVVRIDSYNEGGSFSTEEVIRAFVVTPTDLARVEALTGREKATGMILDVADPKERPHKLSPRELPMDRFTDEMRMSEVGKLVGIKWSGSVARVGWLDANGDFEYNRHTTNASLFKGEEETLLKIWGPGTAAQWQAALDTDRTTHTAAQVLQLALLRLGVKEAFKAGATLAARYRIVEDGVATYGTLVSDLMDARNADDVQALIDAKPAAAPSAKRRKALPALPPAPEQTEGQDTEDAPRTAIEVAATAKVDHTKGRARTSTRPFREAIADPRDEEYIIRMKDGADGMQIGYVARISNNPSKHGLFERVLRVFQNEDGTEVERTYYTQVTDFVLFLDTINASRAVAGMDAVEVTGRDYSTVSAVLPGGRTITTRPLDMTASRSPTTVIRELSTFKILSEPYDEAESRAFKAMITEIGAHAVERKTVLNRIDWHTDSDTGRLMYVTPNGALWIDPTTGQPAVVPTTIAAESAKNSAMRGSQWQSAIGFTRIATPDEVASQMPQMIADYTSMLPGKRHVAQALLGSFFLSFLPGGNRSACLLVGINGSGKSWLMKHLALLMADHRPFAATQPMSVDIDKDTDAAARTSTYFQGTAPNFLEDFFLSDKMASSDADRRIKILEEAISGAFSGTGAGRASGTDERADRKTVSSTPFITAEALKTIESRIGRSITIPLVKGDIDIARSKAFFTKWIVSGNGRALLAGWLAAVIAEHDSTQALSETVRATRTSFEKTASEINEGLTDAQADRISGNATQVLGGVSLLSRYSPGADWNIENADWVTLPDAEMAALVKFLSDDNVERVMEANPAHKMIAEIASGTAAKKLYFQNWAGGVPTAPDHFGWNAEDFGGAVKWTHSPGATLAGRVSRDGKTIYVNMEAIKVVMRMAGVMGRDPKEIKEKFAEHVKAGTIPGDKVQSKNDMVDERGNRYPMRCFVFDAEKLGFDVVEDAEIDATLPTASGAVKSRQDEAASSDF